MISLAKPYDIIPGSGVGSTVPDPRATRPHAGGSSLFYVDLRPHPANEERARDLLDDQERARADGFVVPGARRRFTLCRAALRVQLCERLGCSNADLSFGSGEHGKPFAVVDGPRSPASFNVSHSGSHGLIGFAGHDGLGVDLEVRRPARDFAGIGERVFGAREQRALTAAASHAQMELFYRLWSLKEALIKALGTGFSLSPATFEVPQPMLEGAGAALFRFPHLPADAYWLEDLGEARFAAARATRMI